MTQTSSLYPSWKAPAQDSETLIWPDPAQILAQTLQNHERLGRESSSIQGVALRDLRRQLRDLLGLASDRPVIADGHQTELYHPGVWSKLALLKAAAEKIGADAVHIAVDTDAPKHLNLRWPGEHSRGNEPITDDPALTSAPWSGVLASPSAAHVNILRSRLSQAAGHWPFVPMALDFLDELHKQAAAHPSLSIALTSAMQVLDESLGLSHRSMAASLMLDSTPYLVLAHHLLARAGEFAAAYNGALREYRMAHRVRTPGRPMPDLQSSDETCEIPFWLDDLDAPDRSRGQVHSLAGIWHLTFGQDSFALHPGTSADSAAEGLRKFLGDHNARLSPRALTLTMLLRLLVADQFVHGIGGARYDQVTDRVIELFFKIEPPKFCVTTSTLYFPTAIGRPRACLPCVSQEGHHLRHALIGEQKSQYLRQIEQSPRGSKDRLQLFNQMHSSLQRAAVADPRLKEWEIRLAEATKQDAEDSTLFDRELFYALQPRDRLLGVIEQYGRKFD